MNGAGRLVAVTNNATGSAAQQQFVLYHYDEAGNQTAQVDALLRTNRFDYDHLGRRIKRTLPGGQHEGFRYDAAGNLMAHTNFNTTVITNQYDVMNRLLVKATVAGVGLLTNFYSASGMLTQRVDEAGLHIWAHDVRDRLLTNTTPVGTLIYSYDANGNQLSLKSTTTDGVDLNYQYDSLNRLTNVVDNRLTGTKNTRYTYDLLGNLATLKYPNGVTNRWLYDSLNRLTNLTWKLEGAARADFAYKLTPAGHRTNLSETVNGVSRVFSWQFDKLYRLTKETVTGGTSCSLDYVYDAVGNRLSRSGSLGSLGSQTLAYSVNDWIDNDSNPNNGSTYFDDNGNTVSLGGAWQYDWANRLTNANGGEATYVYDADGNRIRKSIWYLVATVNPSGWPQVVEEHTGSSPGTLNRRYTYGLDLISQSRWTGSAWETDYYLTDGLGSTRALLNSSGDITDTYVYDAYGMLIASTGNTPNDYLFAGEQWDGALGQYYLRARYVNPAYARFWTMDSYEGNNQDPLSLHKYLYAHGNPVNNIDPSGHETLVSFNISTAIAGGLAGATYGAYSAHRTGRNVWAGAGIGFAGGFVGGGFFGAVPAAVWGTKAGVSVLATFSAVAMNSAINYARAGYYDLAAIDAVIALAPLGLRNAPRSSQNPTGPELASLDIPQTRAWYHEQLNQLATLTWELRFNGQPLEAVARFASSSRNLIRIQARGLMENQRLAAELDRARPMQDVEFYIQKYQREGLSGDDLWHKIIEKALTTSPEVDALSGM